MADMKRDDAAKIPPKALIAVVIGNWLEFYDFIVYSFFAVMIGKAFFPAENEYLSLLFSTLVFGAGFFTRPLGAAVIGAYADRAGRKAAMSLTIGLMALGTALLAFTPTYAQIGIAAPIMLVIARLIQGFSCGGEVGPATTYLLEAASPKERAAFTAWQGISQQFAGIMGAGIGLILAATLSTEDLYDWGWRVPFLIGILIGPVGIYIRRALPETLDKHEAHESGAAVLRELFRHSTPALILGILCIFGPTVTTYVFAYMTSYAINTLKVAADISQLVTLCGYIAALAAIPIGAWLADCFNPKLIVIASRVAFIAAVYPAFLILTTPGLDAKTLVLVNAGLNFIMSLSYGGLYVLLTEAFPKPVRSSGVSLAYALGVTIFGGTTQPAITWLLSFGDNAMVPAYYQIAANVISLIGVIFITRAVSDRKG